MKVFAEALASLSLFNSVERSLKDWMNEGLWSDALLSFKLAKTHLTVLFSFPHLPFRFGEIFEKSFWSLSFDLDDISVTWMLLTLWMFAEGIEVLFILD